jgi:hypothetical protein
MLERIVKFTNKKSERRFHIAKYFQIGLVVALFVAGLTFAWSRGLAPLRSGQPKEKPRAGWLYLVDSNNGQAKANVLLVDPDKGSVVKTFKTDMNPDIAVSPDGSRLYIDSTYTDGAVDRDQLAIVDTSTGEVLHTVDNPNRVSYNVYPPSSAMALSPNGRWLYVLKYETNTVGPETAWYWLETFDTQTRAFLPEKASLGACGWGRVSASTKQGFVQVICEKSDEVHLLNISDTGAPMDSVVPLKGQAGNQKTSNAQSNRVERIAGGFFLDDQNITVMRDGRILKADAGKAAPTEVADAQVPVGKWIHSLAVANNRNKMFVGLNETGSGRWAFREIETVNLNDSSRSDVVKLSRAFDYLILSRDGNQLYAVDAFGKALTVIDATGLREVKTIKDLGVTPSVVIEAP